MKILTDSDFIQKELRSEILNRKRIGYSARNRVCGSRTKRAAVLPSDSLTQKQWKEKNGPVNTYNLSKPMNWRAFDAMPPDLKCQYLRGLIDTYGVNQAELVKMFGISYQYCIRKLSEQGFSGMFTRGKKMSDDQKKSFEDFINCEGDKGLTSSKETEQVVQRPDETRRMDMKELSVTFSGKIDLDQILNTLRYMLNSNTDAEVRLLVSFKDGRQSDD